MKQILIISPDHKLISTLGGRLAAAKSSGSAAILRRYPSREELARVLHLKHPGLVIIGLSETERALELIEDLCAGYPGVRVAAAHTENSSDLILAAVRAGADEYLGPPFEPEHLERLLDLPPKTNGNKAPGGRLICFLPARAGSGASTVAMHAACAASRLSGKRVLLVDFDFHSGAVDFCLRLKPEFTIADAVCRGAYLDEVWHQLTCRWKGVDVLASPREFAAPAADVAGATAVFYFGKRQYDWVVADMPPDLNVCCQEVLGQADCIYVVCTPELVSLHLARRKANALLALGVKPESLRLLVNRVDSSSPFTAGEVGELIGRPVDWTLVNDYKAVSNAYLKGHLVPDDSELGRQLAGLARQFMGLSEPEAAGVLQRRWKELFARDEHPFLSLFPASTSEVARTSAA